MGDLGVFEAMDNAGKLSAEAAANNGFELEKSIDRAIFRAKERFGAYLANSQEFNERWAEVKPQVIQLIAGCDVTPTPGVIRRVGAALRPAAPKAKAPVKQNRPSSPPAKTAAAEPVGAVEKFADAVEKFAETAKQAAVTKTAWTYDKVTHLYTSNDPMQRFACPGCGTQQDHLGFTKCAGCDKTWNSWPVRQQGTDKTSAATHVLMAREIQMRGDQFRMAAMGNVKVADDDHGTFDLAPEPDPHGELKNHTSEHSNQRPKLTPSKKQTEGAFDGPPAMSQPSFGTMPGDNSGAQGAPVAPQQPATPVAAAGDRDGDGDVAGGITEDSPIDQIQDALQEAIVALKDVQMLSVNPALLQTSSATKVTKIATLRTAMDRFWKLHKQMNYVAGMLATEASEAIEAADPRIVAEAKRTEREAHFVRGFQAAAANKPLPAPTKDKRADHEFLSGYVAYFKQAEDYNTGASIDKNFVPTGDDETAAGNRGEGSNGFLRDVDGMQPANEIRGDAGPFDSSQPAAKEFASRTDERNHAGETRGQTGESTSIQPTGARKPLPKTRG